MNRKQRIAVVGAGISGLASAWLLSRQHDVTLFEAGDYLGGHTNTVDVTLEGKTHPVDTGFLVFNEKTYPNLIAMFALLGVDSVETEMSFAVSLENPDLEWAGSNLATIFGQKRNLLRRSFWAMLSDILRFNRESTAWLLSHPNDQRSLRDFLEAGKYSAAFSDWYLLPMAAAIWSCPTGQMRDMPLATFIRFCQNHGLLQVFDRPMWRTVQGGGREYVKKIAAQLDDIRLACPVRAVTRAADGLTVAHDGGCERFDQVVMACHSDQALTILGDAASPAQRELLSAIRYQPNRAVLHTDTRVMPGRRAAWAAWNYERAANGTQESARVCLHYWLNRLQPLPFAQPVLVSLNPVRGIDPARVLGAFDYDHPVFDLGALAAQKQLAIQSQSASVNWAAAKKITLATAGGASITLEGGNITFECPGAITVKAASKSFEGGASVSPVMPRLPRGSLVLTGAFPFSL